MPTMRLPIMRPMSLGFHRVRSRCATEVVIGQAGRVEGESSGKGGWIGHDVASDSRVRFRGQVVRGSQRPDDGLSRRLWTPRSIELATGELPPACPLCRLLPT